jgi:hypothetical protein
MLKTYSQEMVISDVGWNIGYSDIYFMAEIESQLSYIFCPSKFFPIHYSPTILPPNAI